MADSKALGISIMEHVDNIEHQQFFTNVRY